LFRCASETADKYHLLTYLLLSQDAHATAVLQAHHPTVPTAPSMRLPIPNPNPKTHPNSNPIFNPNPNLFL